MHHCRLCGHEVECGSEKETSSIFGVLPRFSICAKCLFHIFHLRLLDKRGVNEISRGNCLIN